MKHLLVVPLIACLLAAAGAQAADRVPVVDPAHDPWGLRILMVRMEAQLAAAESETDPVVRERLLRSHAGNLREAVELLRETPADEAGGCGMMRGHEGKAAGCGGDGGSCGSGTPSREGAPKKRSPLAALIEESAVPAEAGGRAPVEHPGSEHAAMGGMDGHGGMEGMKEAGSMEGMKSMGCMGTGGMGSGCAMMQQGKRLSERVGQLEFLLEHLVRGSALRDMH